MTSYTTRVLTTDSDLEALRPAWSRLVREQERPHIEQDPDWLAIEARRAGEDGFDRMVIALHAGDQLAGVAPFLLRRWRWPCRLGYASVAKFPMRLADLCGESLLAPDDDDAREAIARAIAEASVPYQMIFLESVPVGSSLHRLLESPLLREHFWIHPQGAVSPHRLIELPESFDAYLATFNGKSRRQIQYYVRRLEKAFGGALTLERVTSRAEVPGFLEQAERIGSRSWQGKALGMTIQADRAQRERLAAFADRGWLRSYLLRGGETPLAFALGVQAVGTYYYDQVGYDPDHFDQRPGTALLYRLLQDLCREARPRWLDFRYGDSEYKRIFSNVTYEDLNVYLVRKSTYTGVARASHRVCEVVSRSARTGLDRLGLRERVRHALRGRAGRALAPPRAPARGSASAA